MNIYEKLIEVRKVVPYLQKDKESFNYSYVQGSTVLGTIKNKMNELKLLLYPEILSKESTFRTYDKTKYNKNAGKEVTETVAENTVTCDINFVWVDAENPEFIIKIPFALFGTQDDISKAFGSGLTYAERYFL